MKFFTLEKPLVFIDLETTGLNTARDRIVDITLLKVYPDGKEATKTRLINPEMPIPSESINIHGITDEKVAGEATFKQIAKGFKEFLEGCDLCGFNIKNFDLPLLEAEFKRAGVEFTSSGRKIIDTKTIYHRYHPRDLEAAYREYCGKELKNSHASDVDARASAEILASQLEIHAELPRDIESLHEFCCDPREANWVDAGGKFVHCDGEITVNFGKKHKDRLLKEVAEEDPEYLEWILRTDFSTEVKKIVTNALNQDGK